MWTLKDLEARASKDPGFTFYTEAHPNHRGRAADLLTELTKLELTGEQIRHLKRQVVEFQSGFYLTTDYLVAYALLNAPAWLAIKPGEWHDKEPEAIRQALKKEAEAARPRRRSKAK